MKPHEQITEADVDPTLIDRYQLTRPQAKLLVGLYQRPRHIVEYFRPIQALIKHDLVRKRPGFAGSSVYEVSDAGQMLAVAYIYRDAQ